MKNKNSPFINLFSILIQNSVMRNKFIQNEDAFFDLYNIEENDRTLIRTASDTKEIALRIAEDLNILAVPGKVAVKKIYSQQPTLYFFNQLMNDEYLRNQFIRNEAMNDTTYRKLAFKTFGIKEELQPSFSAYIDNSVTNINEPLNHILSSIQNEILEN